MKPLYLDNLVSQTAYESDSNVMVTKAHEEQIFEAAWEAMQTHNVVEIVKTLKINGEMAQISYCKEFDCWTLCSKNVGMVVWKAGEIKMYES